MSYSDWMQFSKENVEKVPQKSGVYFLGSEHETTYIGGSHNLHERLKEQYASTDVCIKGSAVRPRAV